MQSKLNSDEMILIGNGVGMAIKDKSYSLRHGAELAFKKLNANEQKSIKNIVSDESFPNINNIESSHDLAYLNLISMLAYRFLTNTKSSENNKLYLKSEALENLAVSINKFIYMIADSFNDIDLGGNKKLGIFFSNLEVFLKDRKENNIKVHIATTNYDDLFYKFLLDKKWMNPSSEKTFFTDGFNRGGKSGPLKFNPKDSPGCSQYLHLHGSSRFYSNFGSNVVRKFPKDNKQRSNKLFPEGIENEMVKFVPHIILSYFDFKNFQIITNNFLNYYFEQFKTLLPGLNKLYILGYGGNDTHINNLLEEKLNKSCSVEIIVHNNGKTDNIDQANIWRGKFPEHNSVLVKSFDNILEYNFK